MQPHKRAINATIMAAKMLEDEPYFQTSPVPLEIIMGLAEDIMAGKRCGTCGITYDHGTASQCESCAEKVCVCEDCV